MSDCFIGEIRPFAISFSPQDWLPCDGSTVPINQYQALYAVIGATYGGDAQNFVLPNLKGRTIIGAGNGPGLTPQPLGNRTGASSIQLSQSQLPGHTHTITSQLSQESKIPTSFKPTPTANVSHPTRYINTSAGLSYPAFHPTSAVGATASLPTAPVSMSPTQLLPFAGAGKVHENRQPFTGMLFCICYAGYFPVRP